MYFMCAAVYVYGIYMMCCCCVLGRREGRLLNQRQRHIDIYRRSVDIYDEKKGCRPQSSLKRLK
jgi:transcription elongation factor Elf1